jgi:hypothetical protein
MEMAAKVCPMSEVVGVPLRLPLDESNVHHDGLFAMEKLRVVPASCTSVAGLTIGLYPGS